MPEKQGKRVRVEVIVNLDPRDVVHHGANKGRKFNGVLTADGKVWIRGDTDEQYALLPGEYKLVKETPSARA